MNRRFQLMYRNVVTSIAFLPAIISLLFFLFSVGVIYLELSFAGADTKLSENLAVLLVKGNDNARQVLGTLIGGVISLTVFSFSMVMVLLNQATSNFTPRIIPGLLTDKKNQFVLGFYIGTIIYCIIIILNVKPGELNGNTPKFGVLLAMLFGITCLFLFIYFIHLISRKLQIDVLIASAAKQAVALIGQDHGEEVPALLPDTTGWYPLCSGETGYLSEVNERRLRNICRQHGLRIEMLQPLGVFLFETDAVCTVSRDLSGKHNHNLGNAIRSCLHFSNEPYGEGNYLYGINQISEAAVKALSPGINDPGTAAIALDYLGHIFCVLLQAAPRRTPETAGAPVGLIRKEHTLAELFFLFIQPIGYYGRQDAKVHAKLLTFYERLLTVAPVAGQELIRKLLAEEFESISQHIQSPLQVDVLHRQHKMDNRF